MNRGIGVVILLSPLCFSFPGGLGGEAAAQKASATYPCGCHINISDVTGDTSASGGGILQSFGSSSQPSANACQSWCATKAAQYVHPQSLSQATAAQACSAGGQNGATIRAYYKTTGMLQTNQWTNSYQPAVALGVLVNKPAITKQGWRCPATWHSNSSGQLGDFTTDIQRCKRLAGSITLNPAPADGTQLSSWGFTWGNEVWAYGSAANGGAPTHGTFVITPKECRFS